MYLLDTDIIIYSLKGHPVLQKNLRRHLNDPLQISIVTCLELYYGAYKSQQVTGNLAKVKKNRRNPGSHPPGYGGSRNLRPAQSPTGNQGHPSG